MRRTRKKVEMNYSHEPLLAAPRVVVQAALKPLIGSRFQPTGFPNLGAAEYQLPVNAEGKRVKCLLVESAQSVANHLENTVWDEAAGDLISDFRGLPYVGSMINGVATDSIREAHRLNSPYLVEGMRPRLMERADIAEKKKVAAAKKPGKAAASGGDLDEAESSSSVDIRKLASAVFYYDPNSVLHGVFLEKLVGLARLTRIVSGFIEAADVEVVQSGGVKNDRIDPSGKVHGGAAKGFGNVPYAKAEYAAKSIEALFSFDAARVRSYGFPQPASRLLLALALWKIRKFLEDGARLRTACDLIVDGSITIVQPTGIDYPTIDELTTEIKQQIAACAASGLFATPAITTVTFTGASGKIESE